MNKIIKGKRYNTESAVHLANWDNGLGNNDLNYCRGELYRTRSGNYFLYGTSGRVGADIEPLSFDEAKEWAEQHLDGDEYEVIFGIIEEESEKEAKEKILVTIQCETVAKLREVAKSTGATVSWLVEKSLKESGY